MSIPKRLPESIRAIGEQLQFLLKPRIWGSISVLTVVGIFFWQFSEHPEWFSLDQESTLNSSNSTTQLTPEEQSIAADIDSSQVLLNELSPNSSLTPLLNKPITVETDLLKQAQKTNKNSESSSGSNPLLESILSGSLSETQQPTPNNSATPANPVNSGAGNTPSSTTSNPNLGLNHSSSSETENTQTAATSPLQQAMQNYLQKQDPGNTTPSGTSTNSLTPGENPSSLSPTPLTPPNAGLNPFSGTTVGVTPFTGTPTITGQTTQPSWSVPRGNTNPAVGTVPVPVQNPYQTNVTLPPAIPTVPITTPTGVPNPGYSNLNSYPYSGQPSNTVPSYSVTPNPANYTVQPVQPNTYMTPSNLNPNLQPGQIGQPQPNFSVPNRVPGRYIGGGEINTFANP